MTSASPSQKSDAGTLLRESGVRNDPYGLANIQDDLEKPFDQVGAYFVAVDPGRFIARSVWG